MKKPVCLTAFLFCVFLISCSKKEEKIPAGIISRDTMVQVMVDLHIAEAHAQFNTAFDDKKSLKQAYYKFVFKKYKINADVLMKSWAFYASHPEILSKIYEDVITGLSKKQAEKAKVVKPKPVNPIK
jgi:hypothetical protein